ncbi:MAG: hypothetical protein OXC40_06630, partial [Proteobacteria bacterium]|nr:hypothetical protein [Pseudomonadota bacterium]
MAQQWLSIVEYARAYNISDMTIRRRIKTGKLSATLKDGKYFIPVDVDNLPTKDPGPVSQPKYEPGFSTTKGYEEITGQRTSSFPANYLPNTQGYPHTTAANN